MSDTDRNIAARVIVIALAVVGAIALAGVVGMALIDTTMMGGMGR